MTKNLTNLKLMLEELNPTPVGGGRFPATFTKMEITPKNNDPKEPKLRDFSYISMTNPPIPFLGLKMAKKGVLEHFCCWRYQFPDHKIQFFSLFWG